MSLLGAKIGIKLVSKIAKEIMENREMKRLREQVAKAKKYVSEPNELDIQMKQVLKTLGKLGKYIEENSKNIAILQRDSHPSQEYICCKKCGCKITKIKNK